MNCFTGEQISRISHLVKEIEKLSDVEKLFLYLQLPCGMVETNQEGKSNKCAGSKTSSDHLFARKPDQDTTQTYTWILSHLEVDPNVSLPKQEVYDEYRAFCQANRFEPLCVADFGKAMKHAFPCIKPRRLGQRGNSRYCYSGLRKKYKIQAPNLPEMIEPTFCMDNDCSQAFNQIIKDCRDYPDQCPINKPEFTGYEVMNLKIETKCQNQQFSHPLNGGDSSAPNTTYSSASINGEQSLKQSGRQQQAGPDLELLTGLDGENTASGEHLSAINSAQYHQEQQQHQHQHQLIEVFQRTGSPDDDDYRHNYPETHSIPHSSMHQQQQVQVQVHDISGQLQIPSASFMASKQHLGNEPATMSSPIISANHNADTQCLNNLAHQHHQSSMNQVAAQFGPSSSLDPSPEHSHYLGHPTGNSHIMVEPCQSPYNSPAPTPYSSFTAPQLHTETSLRDYYSSDCIRYG